MYLTTYNADIYIAYIDHKANQAQSEYKHPLTFRVRVCCHSNETCASIANPPNSAQLGAPPTISPSYVWVRAVAWE